MSEPNLPIGHWDIEIARLMSQVPDNDTKKEIYEMIAHKLGRYTAPGEAPSTAPVTYAGLAIQRK